MDLGHLLKAGLGNKRWGFGRSVVDDYSVHLDNRSQKVEYIGTHIVANVTVTSFLNTGSKTALGKQTPHVASCASTLLTLIHAASLN